MDTTSVCPNCGKPLPANAPKGLCPECVMRAGFPTGTQPDGGAARFVPPTVAELAPHFPQLEILAFIGQGGMGAVYKARQMQLDRIVALKILPPSLGDDPAFAERFTREAKALARLNHPGIVTIHDFGRADGLFFFLMEFVDGVTLRQLLNSGRISPREALAIVPQICDALQYAHDQGIVHRDIKPENVLMDRLGRVKVADFGLAKLVGTEAPLTQTRAGAEGEGAPAAATLTDVGKVMGTPQYMSPEQRENPGDVDHRADIYALGVVFYQMLTGELPGKCIEPPSKKVQIDVRLDEVVLRALEKDPDRRYQQASALKTQIETIAGGGNAEAPGTKASTPPPSPIAESKTRFSRTAIAGACWAPLFIFFFVALLPWRHFAMARLLILVLLLPCALLGITAPFGTTILGWIAIVQIRRSAGKLRGMWLALIDGLVFPVVLLLALAGYASLREPPINLNSLANSPAKLRSSPTILVIEAGVAEPQEPWAWQELQRRARAGQLDTGEGDQIVDGLADMMRRDHPHGYDQPLNWAGQLLDELNERHLTDESNVLAFLEAYCGDPWCDPLPRVRENDDSVQLTCHLESPWDDRLFGLERLNHVRSISIDGVVVPVRDEFGNHWNQQQYVGELKLSLLNPGTHLVTVEVESAVVAEHDMTGLDPGAPPTDWPPAKKRWTRNCQTELLVFGGDTKMVTLTNDPALNPVDTGALSVNPIIIRRRNGQLTAVLSFNLTPKAEAPISVDASLRVGGQTVECGTVSAVKTASGMTRSGMELTAYPASLDPQVGEAEVVLTPNPSGIELIQGVDRIWGSDIVLRHVPLTRQDLAETVETKTEQFREYPVNQSLRELAKTDRTASPEVVEAKFITGLLEADPATTENRYVIDCPRVPAGSVTINISDTNREWVKDNRPPKVIIYREKLAAVFVPQQTNGTFATAILGLRNGEWKECLGQWQLTLPFDLPETRTLGEAEDNFRAHAVELSDWFDKLPDEPPTYMEAAGEELAANMSNMVGAVMSGMNQTVSQIQGNVMPNMARAVTTTISQTAAQIPDIASNLQSMGANLNRQLSNLSQNFSTVSYASPDTKKQEAPKFEFRLVANDGDTSSPADVLPDESNDRQSQTLRVLKSVILDDQEIQSAGITQTQPRSKEILVLLNESGVRKFSDVTTHNVGRKLAIVWKDRVVAAPVIRQPIMGPEVKITGNFTDQETQELLDLLNHRTPSADGTPSLAYQWITYDASNQTLVLSNDSNRARRVAELKTRIEAAQGIMEFPIRDETLSNIAQDAAREDDLANARTAITKMTAFPAHDNAICACARLLKSEGDLKGALDLARLVTAFNTRDSLLKELAK
jgi:Protein kinase domain